MPHRLHVPRTGQLDALYPQLSDAMHFLRRRLDVAERQAGETDHPVWVVLAEIDDEIIVDAQHLVGRLGIVELRRRRENAVDHFGVDAVAIKFLRAQIRITRTPYS